MDAANDNLPVRITSLYVIGQIEEFPRHFKIGITNNVGARVSSLQTGNPRPLEVHYFTSFPDRIIALEIEQRVHQILDAHRVSGEWFEICLDQILDAIISATQELASRLGLSERDDVETFLGFTPVRNIA